MFKMPNPPLQMDGWTKFLVYKLLIFLSFMKKFKILLPFLFEAFLFDYIKIKSVLKMNFHLNIDTYTFPVIKYQE